MKRAGLGRRQDMGNVEEKKAYIRKQMLEKRAGLEADYCLEADKAILKRLLQMKVYRQADVVFTYVSMEGEVDTRQLIRCALADGKRVAVPKCKGKGIMGAYYITGMEELGTGAYGILEPKAGCRKAGPEEIALAVTPCVCCSRSGSRLGYGGGYYDRYLSGTPAVRAALCRERMMVEDIPPEVHDCTMDFVVTEEGVLEFCSHEAGMLQEDAGRKGP